LAGKDANRSALPPANYFGLLGHAWQLNNVLELKLRPPGLQNMPQWSIAHYHAPKRDAVVAHYCASIEQETKIFHCHMTSDT
jgi:hypothetical protein